MWVARPGVETAGVTPLLTKARDEGVQQFEAIAEREGANLNINPKLALHYLRDNLHFRLGNREREGLARFQQLCVERGLSDGCSTIKPISA